jgi:PKD repeat protein
MLRRLALLLLAGLLASPLPAIAGRKKKQNDGLLQVLTPVQGDTAIAHPFVNVLVVLGSGFDDTPADPATFRAKLGRRDVTDLFEPLAPDEIPNTTGFRARIDASMLKIGKGKNKLRLMVRSQPYPTGKRTKTFRDKDRVEFRVEEGANQPPTALAAVDSDLILQGIPIHFDASGSQDADLDGLTYLWDFGDGTTSTEIRPTHTYESIGSGDVTVTLTVSDGVDSAEDDIVLLARPEVDAGRTQGMLHVASDASLEFGVVAVGGTATRTFTVQNIDTTASSQLKVAMETTNPVFTLDPTTLDLGPGESGDVTLTFAPTADGHADARVSLVASAAGPATVSVLAHGFGGAGSGSGPTLAGDPLYFKQTDPVTVDDLVFGIFADGRRISIDSEVGGCSTPGNGNGIGDACFVDADCAANGGTCGGSCQGGPNDGQACVFPAECPDGWCFPSSPFFVEDLCGDPFGNVFLLSDDGTFSEPDPNVLTERSVTLLRLSFDPNGTIQQRAILRRLTTETTDIACDGQENGNLYALEYYDVDDNNCFRIERQALTQIRKSNGLANVIKRQFDTIEGIDTCNDLEDTADSMAISPDGQILVANFEDGGIWRAIPMPRPFLVDVFDTEQVALHPDGSVLYATATNLGTAALVNLYKITNAQVAAGPLSLNALPPCASVSVPTNGGSIFVTGLAGGRAQGSTSDGVAYVAFRAYGGAANALLDRPLLVQGTVAFTSPAGSSTCSAVGLIADDAFDLVSF